MFFLYRALSFSFLSFLPSSAFLFLLSHRQREQLTKSADDLDAKAPRLKVAEKAVEDAKAELSAHRAANAQQSKSLSNIK